MSDKNTQTPNDKIIETISKYPTDGTIKYFWDKDSPKDGVTKDLFYKGVQVAKADPPNTAYCCGLVFEVWFDAIGQHLDLPVPEMRAIKNEIFINRPKYKASEELHKNKGVVDALVSRGLGKEVSIHEAIEGDLIQIWRRVYGRWTFVSGHTAFFSKYVKLELTYWTSNFNQGPSYRTERLIGHPQLGSSRPYTDVYVVRPFDKLLV